MIIHIEMIYLTGETMTEAEFFETYLYVIKRRNTPIVDVDATYGEVFVPRDCINDDGSIQLSLCPKAIRNLNVKNDAVYFRATFNEKVLSISFPLENIKGIMESGDNE